MRMLVPLDLSSATDRVLAATRAVARDTKAEVWLLHVGEPDPDFVGYETGSEAVRDVIAQEYRGEHRKLQEYADGAARGRNRDDGADDPRPHRGDDPGRGPPARRRADRDGHARPRRGVRPARRQRQSRRAARLARARAAGTGARLSAYGAHFMPSWSIRNDSQSAFWSSRTDSELPMPCPSPLVT